MPTKKSDAVLELLQQLLDGQQRLEQLLRPPSAPAAESAPEPAAAEPAPSLDDMRGAMVRLQQLGHLAIATDSLAQLGTSRVTQLSADQQRYVLAIWRAEIARLEAGK